MAKRHHKKRFRITQGIKTGMYILLGIMVFYIILFYVWDCQI